jgi:hypothetical protein
VFCLKVLCAEEFGDTKGILIEVENTTQWQIIVCPFCFVHLVSVIRLTDSDCPFVSSNSSCYISKDKMISGYL